MDRRRISGSASSDVKKAFSIFIGFVHDFAAGCWAATVLAVYRLDAVIHGPESHAAMTSLQREFFYIGLVCIFLVFAAGAGRTFTYAHIGNVYGADAERLRRNMLVAKHILLLLLFGFGTWWQYRISFHP